MNKEQQNLIKETEQLIKEGRPESEPRINELAAILTADSDPEVQQALASMRERIATESIATLSMVKDELIRRQLEEKAYKLIPWQYIAKTYFGKSASWLSQRINGTKVNGKSYTLNAEQKQTLNRAFAEIGKYIGSYRLA